MFKTYSALEYLCIDIANTFGSDKAVGFKGDKALFEERIDWVKKNYSVLEQRVDEADEKELYIKAVMALRDVVAGKPTGHLISLDGVCSGIQIMSAITGCIKGGDITGLVNPNKRSDAYSEITDELNQVLIKRGLASVQVSRDKAKEAIMPSIYGSKVKPIEVFGEELLPVYYEACFTKAQGAFTLLDILINSWQPYALKHDWVLPDGHYVHIKTMSEVDTKIEIDELNHHKFATKYYENKGTKRGVKLAAHTIHSIDAYVLRSVLRRTNYKPKVINQALELLTDALESEMTFQLEEDELEAHSDYFDNFKMADATTLPIITADNVTRLSKAHIKALIKMATNMLQYKPFSTLTVHDAFRCHPSDGNAIRYWYKEILAELAESEILNVILMQITGNNPKFKKLSNNLPTLIRNSNYSLG